jgi:NOL1/NOP2/fmu family ribosome biogenesis protein
MSTSLNSDVPAIELSREEALRYLKKEAIPNSSGQTGWHILRYLGRGLGWGNALPNRINNGLPKSWRIRKEIE